jgi:hypothetical protein
MSSVLFLLGLFFLDLIKLKMVHVGVLGVQHVAHLLNLLVVLVGTLLLFTLY